MYSDALIEGDHRLVLVRVWDHGLPVLVWVMLNPSTADHTQDDPTIRRCIGFAKSWGYGGILVVNLFSIRLTDSAKLYRLKREELVTPKTDAALTYVARKFPNDIVCAWGARGGLYGRGEEVLKMLFQLGARPKYLRLTRDGSPEHPLYLPAALTLKPVFG